MWREFKSGTITSACIEYKIYFCNVLSYAITVVTAFQTTPICYKLYHVNSTSTGQVHDSKSAVCFLWYTKKINVLYHWYCQIESVSLVLSGWRTRRCLDWSKNTHYTLLWVIRSKRWWNWTGNRPHVCFWTILIRFQYVDSVLLSLFLKYKPQVYPLPFKFKSFCNMLTLDTS